LSERHPRAWLGSALLVAAIVLLLLAVGLAAVGVAARVDASDERARAEPVALHLNGEIEAQRRSIATLATLRSRALEQASSLRALLGAVRAQVESANHAVAVANHAADLYNSGDAAGAMTALGTDGDAAVNDLDAKTRAVRDALTRVQQGTSTLEDALRG
jgi:hypothetical protein